MSPPGRNRRARSRGRNFLRTRAPRGARNPSRGGHRSGVATRTPGDQGMSDPIYVANVRLEKLGSLHRRAHLPLGVTADMGVHGAIVPFYRLPPGRGPPPPGGHLAPPAPRWNLRTPPPP